MSRQAHSSAADDVEYWSMMLRVQDLEIWHHVFNVVYERTNDYPRAVQVADRRTYG